MAVCFNFLFVFLVLSLEVRAEWLDCTPPGQTVVACSVSNDSDYCLDTNERFKNIPSLPKVANFTASVFRARKFGPLGVKLSWHSPNFSILSSTEGYVLKLQARDNLQSNPELCRYFKVNKTKSSVSVGDANPVTFTYNIKSLQKEDITYQAELYTLPFSRRHGFAARVSFRSSSATTATPLVYDRGLMNLQIDNSKPYTLSGSFRMSSHFPALRKIYKHVAYEVVVVHPIFGTLVKGIPEAAKTSTMLDATKREYANFELKGLLPGHYSLEVRPYKTRCDELSRCFPQVSFDEVEAENVTVQGADYNPIRPVLHISPSNDVKVTFLLAPSSYYIDKYFVTLRKKAKPEGHSFTSQVTLPLNGDSSDEWISHTFKLNAMDVLNHFHPGEAIVAEVTPKLNPTICEVKGHCNLNGTCTPCSRSISLDRSLSQLNVDSGWVIGTVILVLVFLVGILALLVVCVHRKIHGKGRLPASIRFSILSLPSGHKQLQSPVTATYRNDMGLLGQQAPPSKQALPSKQAPPSRQTPPRKQAPPGKQGLPNQRWM